MKGLVFAGCSFTWGQGLYYYSKLDTLKEPEPNAYDPNLVTDAHKRFAATLRYPRLVANHFNTFEVVSYVNSGSEKTSMDFINKVFNLIDGHTHMMNEKFSFSEIEYIVVQLSQPNRNPYNFTYKGEECFFHTYTPETKTKFYEWLVEEKKWTFENWYLDHLNKMISKIKKSLKFFESKGVKTLILSWEEDYVPLIIEDQWLNDRFVTLNYKEKEYKCIRKLMNENIYLSINNDYDNFEYPPQDHHPSKYCHQIIANGIIKKIEKDLENPIKIIEETVETETVERETVEPLVEPVEVELFHPQSIEPEKVEIKKLIRTLI